MSRGDPTYWRVSPNFWRHAAEHEWSDDCRQFALYLLTCPHRTTEGLYWLPIGYMATDLAWVTERVTASLATLEAEGFVDYDHKASIVLLPKAMKYQRPDNPNQWTFAIKNVKELPRTSLFAAFLAAAEEYAQGFAQALQQAFPQALQQGYTDPLLTTALKKERKNTLHDKSCAATADPVDNSLDPPKDCPPKLKTRTAEQWQAEYDELLSQCHHPSDVMQLADIMAAGNKTGAVAVSRVVRELLGPIVEMQSEISDAALRHGLRAAITARAPNANYVKRAAENYQPGRPVAPGRKDGAAIMAEAVADGVRLEDFA